MDLYASARPRGSCVGDVVYTAKEVHELVGWIKGQGSVQPFEPNVQTFERLARRHVRSLKPWELRRALEAWGARRRR